MTNEYTLQMIAALHEMQHAILSYEAGNITGRRADSDFRDNANSLNAIVAKWRQSVLEKK